MPLDPRAFLFRRGRRAHGYGPSHAFCGRSPLSKFIKYAERNTGHRFSREEDSPQKASFKWTNKPKNFCKTTKPSYWGCVFPYFLLLDVQWRQVGRSCWTENCRPITKFKIIKSNKGFAPPIQFLDVHPVSVSHFPSQVPVRQVPSTRVTKSLDEGKRGYPAIHPDPAGKIQEK